MGTVVRMAESGRRPAADCPRRMARPRRRWRFKLRGLIGLALTAVMGINLYVMADNVVRLIKGRQARLEMQRRLAEALRRNDQLRKERDWMRSDEFLREQAHDLGYVAPGDTLEVESSGTTSDDNPVKRRRSKPCPPY